VNTAIIIATLRQRFTSPMRLALLGVLGGVPMLMIILDPRGGFGRLGDGYFLALILAAGMIGQSVSTGTIQLLLARPVTRAQYVFSTWAAVTVGTCFVFVLQALSAALIMLARGAPVPWGGAGLFLANDALVAMGLAAVMALLSAIAPGLGDLGLLLLTYLSTQLLLALGSFKSWGVLVGAAAELEQMLKPQLDLWPIVHGGPVSWFAVVSYFSTVTLCLALAVMVMNRKELSYVSAGG
jgi:ABC-type transport system involved in multi-copper enzyme maturation permease subunit